MSAATPIRQPWTPLVASVVATAWLGAAVLGASLAYVADRLVHGTGTGTATALGGTAPAEVCRPRSIWETEPVAVEYPVRSLN